MVYGKMYTLFATQEDEDLEDSKVVTTEMGNEFTLNECERGIETLLYYDDEFESLVHASELIEYLECYYEISVKTQQEAIDIAYEDLDFGLVDFNDFAEIKEYGAY